MCLVTSEAFRTASPRSIKALLVLGQHHSGFNNGKIGLGFRELAEGMDSQYHAGNIAAVGELIARGIVALSAEYPKGQRLAREYRLTFIPTATGPATHDYINWTVGDAGTRYKSTFVKAGTRKNGLADTATETPQTAAVTATELEKAVALITTGKKDTHGNPPFLADVPVEVSATHIVNQFAPLSGVPKNPPEIAAGPQADELRHRANELIERIGRGTQGKLAKEAGVSAASMSRFLNNASDLDNSTRVQLSLAIPKVERMCTGAPLRRAAGRAA